MFSLLSQGYGTWDGTAKRDVQEVQDRKDYFSLEDFHLPAIGSNTRTSVPQVVGEDQTGPRYENKPFHLPNVNVTKPNPLPKTYTTRKGALLLYTEDCFLPGSSRPWKKRRKLKKEPSVMLKTLGDLRNVILDYKNGGDPLFLALLQKRLSGLKRRSVRPGFSPKRYIAVLGNSLEEDAWNRLAAAGSLKGGGLTKNAELPPIPTSGPICNLFPDKPQPYSTLSLPPVSPAGSMFESSFNFYKNGMSTGAASLISIDSDGEEYAPSSRAVSPSESLNNRLSEVEFLPRQRDQYTILNTRQKEDILSQLLLQKTIDSLNSDRHDGWPPYDSDKEGDGEYEVPQGMNLQLKTNSMYRGSLMYEPLPPIPHFSLIQSADAGLTAPLNKTEQNLPTRSSNCNSAVDVTEHVEDVKQVRQGIAVEKQVDEDMLDLDAIHVELTSSDDSSLVNRLRAEGSGNTSQLEGAANKSEEDLEEEKFLVSSNNQKHENSANEGGSPEGTKLKEDISGELTKAPIQPLQKEDVDLENKNTQEGGKDTVEIVEDKSIISKEVSTSERGSSAGQGEPPLDSQDDFQQPDKQSDESEVAAISRRGTESVEEDEGIGLDGGELNSEQEEEVEMDVHQTAEMEETEKALQQGQSTIQESEKASYFNLEDLQVEARGIANKVLSRPQSGVVLMEDVKAAMAMWADRLSQLLGPPNQDARVSSAGRQRARAAGGGVSRNRDPQKTAHTRQRKVTRSAVPSLVALRKALEITGGEVPGEGAFRNLPPLPQKFTRSQHPSSSGVSNGHKVKRDAASRVHSGSLGSSHSITWERISNADVRVDIFDYVTKDEDPSFQREKADEVVYEDSDDDEFQEAVSAVVTEVKNDYNFVNVKSKKTVSSPKKEEKPFQFPRPTESKPPNGLKTKQEPPTGKGKEKIGAKKAGQGKKKVAKKPLKQQQKPIDKTLKAVAKEKEEALVKDDLANVEEVKIEREKEKRPDPGVRVDSETGNWEVNSPERTVVSSLPSPPAPDEIHQSKHNSPAEENVAPSPAVPHIVPKAPALQAVEEETKQEHSSRQETQKPQESRAAKRAAERAAAAEKRRQEVERKRREREEAKKRAMEEEARLEQIRLEAEMEMKKREEERRQQREEKEEANRRKIDEEVERERLAKIKAEKDRRAREEWKQKQQQVLARRKLEDEIRKEREKIEEEIEAARLKEEEERIKAMEESERVAFLEKVRREEEELRLRMEEQKKIEEEEKLAQEEENRQRQEALALLRQKHFQRHLFISGILKEKLHLSLSHRLTKAFTFSYFDLIPWNHLLHLQPGSVRVPLHEVKRNIPPTIIEEEEQLEK